MKGRIFALTIILISIFSVSCARRTPEQYNRLIKNQTPVGGIQSSIIHNGNIENVRVVTDSAQIRSGITGSDPVIHSPERNSILKVVSQVEDWFAVKTPNNQTGFIPKAHVKPVVTGENARTAPKSFGGVREPSQYGTPNTKTPSPPINTSSLSPAEQQMINLVNQARSQNNLPSLKVDMQLENVARTKAQDMIDNNYFSHYSPRYGSPFDMMKNFGVKFISAGENIAGNRTVQAAEIALMSSPEHRKNILDPNFTHIGIGIRNGGPYGSMFSQMFISRPQ